MGNALVVFEFLGDVHAEEKVGPTGELVFVGAAPLATVQAILELLLKLVEAIDRCVFAVDLFCVLEPYQRVLILLNGYGLDARICQKVFKRVTDDLNHGD